MIPQQFVAKWKKANLSERSAAHQHFLDLCEVLGQPKPAAADPDGAWYTFERGVRKAGGGQGWADVWMRGRFAWEYKKKHRDLAAAYQQLLRYHDDLDNPPLLVVCDLDRFEVHTKFTNTAARVYHFDLDDLCEPDNLDTLRKVFTDPDALRPQQTPEQLTALVAGRFARLTEGMRLRQVPALTAAHFLMKLMFCMFAERIGLLPDRLFTRLLSGAQDDPPGLARRLKALFAAMASGGEVGIEPVRHFNGGLFADAAVVELTVAEIHELAAVNGSDWGEVEPTIFGTLFERTLDPDKRAQIGAHYTGKDDILVLLEPVLMAPLRREWDEVRARCEKLWPKVQAAARKGQKSGGKDSAARQAFDKVLLDFDRRLAGVKVLDPACGSGNFLYVAVKLLLDLERQVITYGSQHDVSWYPHVKPTQLLGIEINPYAQQLAQVVIWIGYLQWMHQHGYPISSDPVLEPFESIRLRDAVLDLSDPGQPREPEWPEAEFLVGNPPFLGSKKLRAELGDDYVDRLFAVWRERVRPEADLCCYWFEKARAQVEAGKCRRAGLLATQGIRGGANRDVLERIKQTGGIFFAESDRDWVLDGANVHVSMVGFDDGTEQARLLDGKPVERINANLSAATDITKAARLESNLGLAFMGDTKGGPFEIPESLALTMVRTPNPNNMPSSDVLVPWVNGLDVTRRPRDLWMIDFGPGMPLDQACLYEAPFGHVKDHLEAVRRSSRTTTESWWLHERPRVEMRKALLPLPRFLATATVSKHRLFVWMEAPTLPDHQLIVFARSDDYFFGVLHSRIHEVWARAQGTQVRERESGFRYTPTTCFETFPLPTPTDEQREAIAAAKELDALRGGWLNPPEWTREEVLEFPGSARGPWARFVHDPDGRGVGTVRYPRRVPRDEDCAARLRQRTLTSLYNDRPTWLAQAHARLDAAVFAAYGWGPERTDEDILAGLLALNGERARA